MTCCCKHRLTVVEDRYTLDIAEQSQCVSLAQDVRMVSADYPTYDGPTEITPTRSTQAFQTNGQVVLTDLIVNPIPSNYGLITDHGGGRISVS